MLDLKKQKTFVTGESGFSPPERSLINNEKKSLYRISV